MTLTQSNPLSSSDISCAIHRVQKQWFSSVQPDVSRATDANYLDDSSKNSTSGKLQLKEMAAVAALFVEYNIYLMKVWDSGLCYMSSQVLKACKVRKKWWSFALRLQVVPQTTSAKSISLLQTGSINHIMPTFGFIDWECLVAEI